MAKSLKVFKFHLIFYWMSKIFFYLHNVSLWTAILFIFMKVWRYWKCPLRFSHFYKCTCFWDLKNFYLSHLFHSSECFYRIFQDQSRAEGLANFSNAMWKSLWDIDLTLSKDLWRNGRKYFFFQIKRRGEALIKHWGWMGFDGIPEL